MGQIIKYCTSILTDPVELGVRLVHPVKHAFVKLQTTRQSVNGTASLVIILSDQ